MNATPDVVVKVLRRVLSPQQRVAAPSCAIVAGRADERTARLSLASRIRVVTLYLNVGSHPSGSTVHCRYGGALSIDAMLLLAAAMIAIAVFSAIASAPSGASFWASFVPPLIAITFVIVVTFGPAMGWIGLRYTDRQRAWLTAYAKGLLASLRPPLPATADIDVNPQATADE